MVSHYLYQVDLPFSRSTVYFKEIPTIDQIFITKSLLSLPNSDQKDLIAIQRLHSLLQKNIQDFDLGNLSMVEVFLLALRIRSVSMGSIASLQVSQSEKQTTIEIDFENILKNLYLGLEPLTNWGTEFVLDKTSINIQLGWPCWYQFPQLIQIIQSQNDPREIVKQVLPLFLKKIIVTKDKNISEFVASKEVNLSLGYGNFPASIQQYIQGLVLKNIEHLASIDLFGINHLKDLKFNLFDPSLLEIFKMIFLFDLKDIHREIFELSPSLGAEYVLQISAMERKLYLSFIPDQNDTRTSPVPQNPLGNTAVQQLAQEFGV